ncbi:MAG: hypothetical protein BWY05_01049 [Euryarchaeota archaeon ADurb.Bin165]|nr:MAG: hypothetical protein BWY05_01049 [Euryarchaeota archaeon ADurb.Bin165]
MSAYQDFIHCMCKPGGLYLFHMLLSDIPDPGMKVTGIVRYVPADGKICPAYLSSHIRSHHETEQVKSSWDRMNFFTDESQTMGHIVPFVEEIIHIGT